MNDKYVFKNFNLEGEAPSSDLACERRRADIREPGVEYSKTQGVIGVWERITVSSEEGARQIGRPRGCYNTLNLPRMDGMDQCEIEDAKDEVARELCRLFDREGIKPDRLLVVGLGNRALTPDAVGPESADRVRATMHIKEMDDDMFEGLDCSEIAVIKPGVTAESGIDTRDIVEGVCSVISPDAIIVIDALASRSPTRLGTTIQLATTGLSPGSGLGNRRGAITEEELGIPVFSIGVPTVINSRMFIVENGEARAKNEKEGMFVAPKDINDITKNASKIVAGAINQAFGIDF